MNPRPGSPAYVLLAVSIVLGVVLRVWGISQLAPSGDENHYQIDVRDLLASHDRIAAFREHFSASQHQPDSRRQSNVGHPSLAVALMAAAEGGPPLNLGLARLMNGFLGLATAAVVFLTARRAWGGFAAAFAASLALLLPLAIRYDRTLYLDPAFGFFWSLILLLLSLPQRLTVSVGLGLAVGALISTKTTGLLAIPLVALSAVTPPWKGRPRARVLALLVTLLMAGTVGVFASDPSGYLSAILYPSDADYRGRSPAWYLWYLVQWQSVRYLLGIAVFLVTLPVIGLALLGLVTIGTKLRQSSLLDRTVLLGLLVSLPIALLHLPGLSAEHGFLVYVPVISLLAARGLLQLSVRLQYVAWVLTLVVLLPLGVVYGLRLAPTPYPSYLNTPDFGRQYYQLDRSLLRQW